MNLRYFLTEVDQRMQSMPKEKLELFVHEMARSLPESQRSDFLLQMECASGKQKKKKKEMMQSIKQECEYMKNELEQIELGEVCLEAELNYEYDDWYDGEADEYIFSDPEGIIDVIEEAGQLLHRCVDQEEYQCGYELSDILIGMRISVCGDEWYGDEPFISDLQYYHLSDMDYENMVLDALYVTYCANQAEDRADALYRMILNSKQNGITLERIMQHSNELADIEDFLPIWIDYLGGKNGQAAQELLEEAFLLCDDSQNRLGYVQKYGKQHPSLYEQYLLSEWETADGTHLFEIGDEALKTIEDKYVIRGRIAGILSKLCLKQGDRCRAEKYWLELFRSDTTVVNYLRLFIECADYSVFAEKVRKVYKSFYTETDGRNYVGISSSELRENYPERNEIYLLIFLNGEFQFVKEHVMNVKGALGWSSTFMKSGLAAYLLLLLNQEELQAGCKKMCSDLTGSIHFSIQEYQKYTDRKIDGSDAACFWECLLYWKKQRSISEDEAMSYLHWIQQLLKKRVKGIMDANRRNYYGECAAYIAALGEVLESRGKRGAKQALLLEYKTKYSRRSAFHRELRVYGLRDGKKAAR